MDHYSPSEFLTNCLCYVRTKVFYSQCRFIRFPFYIRGKKSMVGAERLTLGRFCRFELDGTKKTLNIGKGCEMGDMTHIVAMNNVTIGDNVLIASKCFISDTSHGVYNGDNQDAPDIPPNQRKLESTEINIGNNVWIGENVVVLPGSDIGDGCIVGANSVVIGKYEANSIIVGQPALVKKTYSYEQKKWIRGAKRNEIDSGI